MARKTTKPPAEDRTIGLFTQKTPLEEAQEALKNQQLEDAKEEAKDASPKIEDNLDRYRNQAFQVQEWTSKAFGAVDVLDASSTDKRESNPAGVSTEKSLESCSQWRLSKRNGWLYLEQTRSVGKGMSAYHYAGVMFPESALEDLAEVFQRAVSAKAR